MQVHTYTLFGKKELAAIQAGLDNLLAIWAEKWLMAGISCPSVTAVSNAFEANLESFKTSDASWTSMDLHNAVGTCTLGFPSQTHQPMYRRITGDNSPRPMQGKAASPVETGLVAKVLSDLLATILSGMNSDSTSVATDKTARIQPELHLQKGSGTVAVTIADQECVIHLLLSPTLAWHLAGNSQPKGARAHLTSRKSVIGHGKMKVRVTAGEINLRLSDILELKPGHVMRLNMKTDRPFVLETADTQTKICDAYLGQRDGCKAIQLINQ